MLVRIEHMKDAFAAANPAPFTKQFSRILPEIA